MLSVNDFDGWYEIFRTGMIHKELAEKIGVQEQQIQRYESNHYSSANFDRLRSIADALKIEITQAVMQLETQPKF